MSLDEYDRRTLRRFGFGENQTFASLVEDNRYLYRVYDAQTEMLLVPGRGFVADRYRNYPIELDVERQCLLHSPNLGIDAVQHVDNEKGKKPKTPFISTTFSLTWAIFEANRRATNTPPKERVMIAVIDGQRLLQYAKTALELLKMYPEGANSMLKQFANASQEVLVYAYIPEEAILATVPWEQVFAVLPSNECQESFHCIHRSLPNIETR